MEKKVFISSTYSDLIPYRKQVWGKIEKLNIEILGMEKFGARKSTPLETCLVEVSKCDIFIGIISFRFGSVDKSSKKSFTQLEYEKAYDLNKEIMIYLMDDDALVFPKNVDKGNNAQRLKAFKKQLQELHTFDTLKEPKQLAVKIHERLKILLHNLSMENVRPRALDCKITRFNFNADKWIAFVGFYNNKPYEIFTGLGDEEIFPIPKSVVGGKIIKNSDDDGEIRFDFQYTDKYGYKKNIEGLSHMFTKHTQRYSSMITKLLQKDFNVTDIESVIDDMDIFEGYSSEEWKQGVKIALGIKEAAFPDL